MWPIVAFCVILGVGALLYIGYRRVKAAGLVKDEKIEALEQAAQEKREKEKAQDAKEASEIIDSGDAERALKFLRDSFTRN